jgi:uncharacterized protein DUF6936
MTAYNPMTQLPKAAGYKTGDVLVLCGELFGRGYANGIIDEARQAGMTIIGTTVGRRESDGTLRPLTADELAEAEANLGGKIINIPLEAGFDMEPGSDGQAPVDLLKSVKPDGWDSARFDWASIEVSRRKGTARFTGNLAAVVAELQPLLPTGAAVLFAHAMAGGIPRARVFMPLLNRVFKGQGDKYLSSAAFWDSELGKLCQISFDEVTADTFQYLLEATAPIRASHPTRYVAYGYHGCGVLINGVYTWQSYTPYLQGAAKMRLEEHARAAWSQGISATVYNCPEIQTNSSALFMGVEISLYPLLAAMVKEGDGPAAAALRAECEALLAEGATLEQVLAIANAYLASPLLAQFHDLAAWPHHNTREQAEAMLTTSAELLALNANPKEIICVPLSRAVFRSVGALMFNDSWAPTAPVVWLSHDSIARQLLARG